MRFYEIKKGNHACSMSFFEKLGGIGWKIKSLTLRFSFRKECWWAPARNQDDLDQNKLAGIGFGTNHHNNFPINLRCIDWQLILKRLPVRD